MAIADTPWAVIGAGSWGTALAIHAARSGHTVTLWARDAAQATLAARGMQVAQPTPAVMEGLSRISQTIAQEWAARAGEDGAKLLAAYRG